jgi:hypothetical protein
VGAGACEGTQYCITSGAGFGPCECGGLLPDAAPPDAAPHASPDAAINPYPDCPMCLHAQYVIGPLGLSGGNHGITIPQTVSMAMQLGCDIDGDGQVDNQLGKVFVALMGASSTMNLQTAADHAFTAGRIILLIDLEYTPALINTSVAGVKMYVGVHDQSDGLSAPGFYDGGRFFVTQSAGSFGGQINGVEQGQFGPGPALIELPLAIDQPPVPVPLEIASLNGFFSNNYIGNGKLCGAIRATDVQSQLIPSWAADLSAVVKAGGSDGNMIRSLFDADHSCDTDPNCVPAASGACFCITAAEIEYNSIIRSLLNPDLDLDPMATNPFVSDTNDPTYRNDAISIGVGIEANTATFPAQ